VDVAVQHTDLAVIHHDEISEDAEAVLVGVGQLQGVELGGATRAPHVTPTGQHAVLGHHCVRLGLQPRAQVRQLGPEADQFP
jgi:hypothetical protein